MCTTILILGPLVLMLRRRFCNKVEPYVLSCPPPVPSGLWGWGWDGEGEPRAGGSHSSTHGDSWRYLGSCWFWFSGGHQETLA